MSLLQRLVRDGGTLGVDLTAAVAARLIELLDELERWNRTYNLTAVTDREEMLTHHLLDSLSIQADLHGETVADVGTGAGFPGLPLALVNPERRFTLIDSSGKKIRFVSHMLRTLKLTNAEAVQARVESLQPARPFDTVVARAFAPLPELLRLVGPVCGPATRVLAMKGKPAAEEIEAVPDEWQITYSRVLSIPGLQKARSVILLERPGRTSRQ